MKHFSPAHLTLAAIAVLSAVTMSAMPRAEASYFLHRPSYYHSSSSRSSSSSRASSSSRSSAVASSSSSSTHYIAWSPEQATGRPNTSLAGDKITAWASLTEDNHDEWLTLSYDHALQGSEIDVYETYNPGALQRVTVFDGSSEVEVWRGTDPVVSSNGKGIAVIPVNVPFAFTTVKLYLASMTVKGWNEIDAVGVKENGTLNWAATAKASSTYAKMTPAIYTH